MTARGGVPILIPSPTIQNNTQRLRQIKLNSVFLRKADAPFDVMLTWDYHIPQSLQLMIFLCAVLSGGQTAVDMAVFGEVKQQFLSNFLELRNGLPSHDTFNRVFRRLDPDQFRASFQKFMARFGETYTGVTAIDGKPLRRSFGSGRARSTLHMISAWCCNKRLVLAQIATNTKRARARPC